MEEATVAKRIEESKTSENQKKPGENKDVQGPRKNVQLGEEKKEEKKLIPKKKFSKSPYFREFTEYEQKVNFSIIDRETQSLENKYYIELGNIFKLSINALMNTVTKKKIVERKRIEEINKLELPQIKRMGQLFNGMIKDAYQLGVETIESRVKKMGIVEPNSTFNNEDVVKWIDETSAYTLNIESEEILKKVKGVLIDGIRTGAGSDKIIRMINKELSGYDTAGEITANRLDLLVRTDIGKGFNQARLMEYMEISEEIRAMQFSAIMDTRTSLICTKLDKKVFRKEEMEYYNPPLHYRCRSLLVPIFIDEPFKKYDIMPKTERVKGGFLELVTGEG